MSRLWTWRSGAGMLGLTSEQLGTVLMAASLAFLGIIGGQKGRQMAKGKQPEVMEVAGALVSDKAADRIVSALDENTKALNRNSGVCETLHEAVKEVDDRLERLKDEIIRGQSSIR